MFAPGPPPSALIQGFGLIAGYWRGVHLEHGEGLGRPSSEEAPTFVLQCEASQMAVQCLVKELGQKPAGEGFCSAAWSVVTFLNVASQEL